MAQTRPGPESDPPSPERVAALVQSLAEVMQQNALAELDVDFGTLSVRLRRPRQEPDRGDDASFATDEGEETVHAAHNHVITAPMIGTFYSSSTPGAQPFVTEGDEIFVGQTIGIIEAMKIMNEISADRSGTVESIFVGNGQPVEYGSPLMRLDQPRGGRA